MKNKKCHDNRSIQAQSKMNTLQIANMKNKISLLFASLVMLTAFSCKKATDLTATTPTTPTTTTVSKIAPDGFTYMTTKKVTVSISTLTNANKAIAGVPVSIYS